MRYEYVPTQEMEEKHEGEPFQITDDHKANWALKKIKQLKADQEYNIKFAEEEIHQIEQWLESINKPLQDSIDHFRSMLGAYAMNKREEDPEFKTSKLPNGTFRFKKQQPKYTYDDKALLEYLKKSEETDLIRIKEEPNKSAIKKLFPVQDGKLVNLGTGEIIDGVTVEDREDKFEVIINE